MEQALAGVRSAVAGQHRPRTLLVFERDRSSLQNIYASGRLRLPRGPAQTPPAATTSSATSSGNRSRPAPEMILARRPDVIIELRYGQSAKNSNPARDLRPWDALGSVPAVKAKQIHRLVGDQYVVPGPRIVDAARAAGSSLAPKTLAGDGESGHLVIWSSGDF